MILSIHYNNLYKFSFLQTKDDLLLTDHEFKIGKF